MKTYINKRGATKGLAQDCSREEHKPEQVYVFTKDWAEEADGRPIEIQGWVGYDIPERMRLTRAQAKELAFLLIEAVTDDILKGETDG